MGAAPQVTDRSLFDLITAALWFTLAALGIALRCRRMLRLRQIVLVEPVDQRDADYLASIRRSTYLRMLVKFVFLVGALIALFGLTWLWPIWRIGIVAALVFMLLETMSVDMIRDRLGKAAYDEAG